MDMNSRIAAKKNIIKINIKLLSLSTIVFIINSNSIFAQTITAPIVVDSSNTPILYNNEIIDIDATGTEAIKVGNSKLSITNSVVTLKSDKTTINIKTASDVTISGADGASNTVISTASSGQAIVLNGASTLTIDGLKVIAAGDSSSGIGATAFSANGVYNQVNATLNLSNSQIHTVNVRALSVRDNNVTAKNFSITTGRDEATGDLSAKKHLYGINAESKNILNLTNGDIKTWTDGSNGINLAMDVDDTSVERAKINNINVATRGNNATGIDNINTRSAIYGGKILTYGIGAHGIGASNGGVSSWAPSHVSVAQMQVTTNGRQAYGLVATTNSDIQAKGINITTTGESAAGIFSQGTGLINISEGSQIITSGEGAHGAAINLGSEVNITNSSITTTGTNASGIYMAGNNFADRSLPPAPVPRVLDPDVFSRPTTQETVDTEDTDRAGISHSNKVTITGSTLDVANAAALRILGGENNTLTITGFTIKADQGANALLFSSDLYKTEHEVGIAQLNVASSKLSGDVLVNSGEVNIDLTNKSHWSGAARIGADNQVLHSLTLDSGSTWLITGNSTIYSLANTGGVAFYPSNSKFKSLTVQSDYSSSGGLFAINTKLGDDNSETDTIIFNGAVSGTNQLAVRNAGGVGAQTIDGIKVIEVGAPSDGVFTLVGAYRNRGANTVVAGAYTYKLYQGSISDPTDSSWYLRSDLDDDNYQAGVPVYEVYPQFLLGLNTMPTMQQRIGNRYWNYAGNLTHSQGADAIEPYASATEAGGFTQSNGVWGRMEGSHTKMKPGTSTSDAAYDYNAFKMQAGLDGMLHESEQGKLMGGLTVHYTHGRADIWSRNDSDLGSGRIKTDGYGFGGTLTWYSDNGFYIDNQAQVTWYRSDLSYQGGQSSLTDDKNNGFGYGFSSEIGKRFTLNDHWSLTPQAQFNYSEVDFDSFADVFGADVSRERAASLQARLGVGADYQNSWRNQQGGLNRSSVYGVANLYNEFLNGTRVDVSSIQMTNKSDRLWAGVGLGGSYNWHDDKYSVYGEGSLNTSLKNFGDSYAYKGTVGFRLKW